jgi:hypothetical protein
MTGSVLDAFVFSHHDRTHLLGTYYVTKQCAMFVTQANLIPTITKSKTHTITPIFQKGNEV